MGLGILDLPTDLLVDCILPLLPLHDFINFTSTCTGFHRLANDEVYFRNLTYKTFRFPTQPLRQEGWKQLFRRIATARLYTWGCASENRLGHSWPIRNYENRGVRYPYEPNLEDVEGMVVDIAVGGWSTTILTSTGAAYTTGQLLGNSPRDPPSDGFTLLRFADGKAHKISQISSGRSAVIGLDDENQLWIWSQGPGKAGSLAPIGLPKEELHKIRNIRAGWNVNSVYIDGYGICVGDFADLNNARIPGTNGTKPGNPTSPTLEGKIGKVIEYIILEHNLLFLTCTGSVYVKSLNNEDPPLLLPTFTASEGQEPLCYLSGSFRNFSVFNKSGLVLLGTDGMLNDIYGHPGGYALTTSATIDLTAPLIPKKEIKPVIKDSLQNRNIIKISFGDYHALALTESGNVLTWGTEPQQCGCFGLGGGRVARDKGVSLDGLSGDAKLVDPAEVDFFNPSLLDETDRESWAAKKPGEAASFFAFNVEAAGWHSGALVSVPYNYPRVFSKLNKINDTKSNPQPISSDSTRIRDRLFSLRGNFGLTPQTNPSQHTGTTSASLPPRHNPEPESSTNDSSGIILDENYVDPDAIGTDDEMNYEEISDDEFAVQNHALHPPRPTRTDQHADSSNSNNPPPPQPGAVPTPPQPGSSSSSNPPAPQPQQQYAPDNAPRYEISDEAAMNPFMMPFIRGGLGPVIPQGFGNTRPRPSNQGEPWEDRHGHEQGNRGTGASE